MARPLQLTITHTAGSARTGQLRTPHGTTPTPAFMPVGTRGTVKGMTPHDLREVGATIVLTNALHLELRPGAEEVQERGGIHRFMGWDGPILSDSGGYQVFSLRHRTKVSEQGVKLCSPVDGSWQMLTPERMVKVQEDLGVDMAMAFDECIEWPADRDRVSRSTARTTRWLQRCIAAREAPERTALLGIVQGGFYEDLRIAHAQEIASLDLDAYAIGGLSVGEPKPEMFAMVGATTPHMPADRLRYLMGVGLPIDIVEAVTRGVDLFDCVLPTRSARFGLLFTTRGRVNIKHARYRRDDRPLDPSCTCYTCRHFSRAYLRHLFISKEVLAPRLLTHHNLALYQALMGRLRAAIRTGPAALESLHREVEGWMLPIDD
jgi:queuine tRNA-ribosyltransferase